MAYGRENYPRGSIDSGLPEELIQSIVRFTDDLHTLYSLCLVSKRFYRVSLPFLYRRFSYRLFTDPSKLHGFIRTIVTKPGLALQTKEIELRDPLRSKAYWDLASWKAWSAAHYRPSLNSTDRYAFVKAGALLHEEDPDRTREIVEIEEAQAALLLTLTPNVSYLLIENPSTHRDQPRFADSHLFMKAIHPLVKQGLLLQNLRTLVVLARKFEGGQGGFRLAAIAPFFRLPNLHIVQATVCEEPEDAHFDGFDCPGGTSSVKDLTFHSSTLCPIPLRLTIMACEKLESFKCDWAGTVVGFVEVNFPAMHRALACHELHLQTLTLDTRKHFDTWPEHEEGLIAPLGSLATFVALTDLDAPASALIGWDEGGFGDYDHLHEILPPNLETLRINVTAPRLYEQISRFATVCSEKCPRLRRITIVDDASDTLQGELTKEFRQAGSDIFIEIEEGREVDHFN